ncbi:tetratricopeptide repeat protein [Alteromonas sp. ALT199]|uniref:tetratricopeptide repeat protein n=1 Tax=unclassified Alteromonas TaxID=2614992 RepID=UPI00044F95AC|nr:tetratricopeptide repeat protein [Alteromonas sp. ALT199]MBT3134611.1 tetratricopeptide repeat protein [Alteromonas sp. ALT199]
MQSRPNIVIPNLINAFNRGDFPFVINTVKQNGSLTRVDAVVSQLYASALRKTGRTDEAAKTFEKGLKLFPKSTDLMNSYGNLFLEKGQSDKAILWFTKAIKIKPSTFDYKYNLARALFNAKRYSEAEKQCRQLLEKQPNKSSVLLLIASILVDNNQEDKAERYLNQLLDNEPHNVRALNNLGNIKRRNGQLEEAIALYKKALSSGKPNAELFQNLAAVLALSGLLNEAFATYKEGLTAFPTSVGLHKEYAHLAWVQNLEAPFSLLETNLSINNPDLVLAYTELMIRVEEFDKAKLWLEKLLEARLPTYQIAAAASLSNTLRELGEFEKALATVSVKASNPTLETLPLLIEKSYSLLSLDRYKEAVKALELVCRIAPLNQGYWTLLSTAYKANGDEAKYVQLCDYQRFVNVTSLLENEDTNRKFISELREYLNTLHNNERHPIGQSLRNGSQTFENLLDSAHPIIKQLKAAIEERAKLFISKLTHEKKHPFLSRLSPNIDFIGSWSVRLRQKGFHKSHYHSEGWLSGVLYVDVPSEVATNGNGWLVFGRPDISGVIMPEDFAIKPQEGSIAFFPSYMWHGTNPIISNDQRLTVAFDIVPHT